MTRKFKFVFVASKEGEKVGRLAKRDTLEEARSYRKHLRSQGFRVSRIAKTSKA